MSNSEHTPSWIGRLRRVLVGPPRDLKDRSIFHHIALLPILAWVGLGADGLSSSAYGPEEAFRTLGEHTYLAVALALVTAVTVFVIAAMYSRIIESFPQGGGGYLVSTSLLGPYAGVVSGCALLVDYVLTITVSVAAAGAALFSFLPPEYHSWKVTVDAVAIAVLVLMNLRGIRESVLVLLPIFIVFGVTHVFVILWGFGGSPTGIGPTLKHVPTEFSNGLSTLGFVGMLSLFLHAYSLGGGTYTGIEAVSNGLSILREPRVQNGKRTMAYMSISLALVASSLLLLYLLWDVRPVEGKTMNAVLVERMTAGIPLGGLLTYITIISEGALLFVAAQAGFMDGPRVLANMAIDSWAPHRFSALSERLTTQNGIVMMGIASAAALFYTKGNVSQLVVLYSINVFITFSLSAFGMLRKSWGTAPARGKRWRTIALFGIGFALCATILVITTVEKFTAGGWLTFIVTGGLAMLCVLIRRHYRTLHRKLAKSYAELEKLPQLSKGTAGPVDPKLPTAVLLVGEYSGVGIHVLLNIFRSFPNVYKNLVFMSVAVVDSGEFKGENSLAALKRRTEEALDRYVTLANKLGMPATKRIAVGTDVVLAAEETCLQLVEEFPRITFFAGKVIFERESWYHRLLHNETALAIQKRLQWAGQMMVIVPARVT